MAFTFQFKNAENQHPFTVDIPRHQVKRILRELKETVCNAHDLSVDPIPLDSIFDVRLNKDLDIEIQPLLRLIQKNGEAKFFERENLKRFQFRDLYYIEELGILAEDQYPKLPPEKFKEPVKTVIKRSQIPAFLAEFETMNSDAFRLDENIKQLKIIKEVDRMEITPESLGRDWCWISVKYGMGNQWVSLSDILEAKLAKQRYVATDEGWIDSESPEFESLDPLVERMPETRGPNGPDGLAP